MTGFKNRKEMIDALDPAPKEMGLSPSPRAEGREGKTIAYVGLSCGKQYLQVCGYLVSMQGDPCRCINFDDKKWTPENMRAVADAINATSDNTLRDDLRRLCEAIERAVNAPPERKAAKDFAVASMAARIMETHSLGQAQGGEGEGK